MRQAYTYFEMNRIIMLLLVIGIKQPNPTNAAYTVRLSGGSISSSGRVEVSNGSLWGTVCDDSWENRDARVVCKMLGYSYGVAHQSAFYGLGTGKILMDDVQCTGTETSLFNCTYSGWGVNNCQHSEDASVDCYNGDVSVRLAGGNSSNEGRVEVYNGEYWGTVCDSSWDKQDAKVVCNMLGYRYGVPHLNAYFGQGNGTVSMNTVNCLGTEYTITDCTFKGWNKTRCGHYNDASVGCYNDVSVRLAGGNSSNEGRVEVYNGEYWGTVCDSGWDKQDAKVVCNMLGYRYGVPHLNAYFGQGNGTVSMDTMDCLGTEDSIIDCTFNGWNNTSCGHYNDASVACYNARDIRLVGGNSSKEGRVEVFKGNEWGTICDTNWDSIDATAVCRMLGYRSGFPYNDAFFGPGTISILMDLVNCQAADESIFNCPFGGWGVSSCSHTDDASVKCSNDTDIQSVHLVGGNSSSVGRVEVFNGQEWGTICNLHWDTADATVVCKMLGYKYGFTYQKPFYGQGKCNISMASVNCLGSEESLFSCRYYSWGVYKDNCGHANDVSVDCSNVRDIRLVGGNVPSAGRVEVTNGHGWGTLCYTLWRSAEAKVVCKMLGYRYGFPYLDAYYGERNGTTLMNDLYCYGSEQTVFDCHYSNWARHSSCHHRDYASVECSNVTDMRLVDGHSASAGRVEVYNGHRWGTVSDNSWDSYDAKVVCKMIGYKYGFPYNDAFYGQGSNDILMSSTGCGSYESSLFDCAFSGWDNRSRNSGHSEEASVECSNVTDIRLVNGSRDSGRIEIYNGRRWGTICGSDWGSKDARVVCKMFGYSFGLPYSGAYYGKGNNSIIMDSISCSGSETSLFNCRFTGWGIRGCNHTNDASVECFNGSSIRLIGGNSSNEGRVEVFNGHEWGTVCDRSWDYHEASVVCKMLGYRAGVPYPAAHFGPGRGRIMMANVKCRGTETSLFDCDFPGWKENMCQHSEDASVSCHNADDFMIRLSGGSSSSNGRVEVSVGNEWGTVCNKRWNKQNADVVCKMLGYSDGIGFAVALYGPGTGRVLMDNVNCIGTESSLLNCTYSGWGVNYNYYYCPHSSDASVQCTHYNCSSNCFNNGVCTGNETCRCPSGFFGSRCENICPNQAHCMSNQTECVPGKTRCNQCVSPYIATDWTSAGPGCREPVCSPTCMNNGSCIADNVCSCTSGFLGSTCEIGGSLDAYLKPVLNPTEQRPFQALSWYLDPAISEYGRVCFLKVHVQSAAKETLMTAISRTTSGQVFGNYTTGPLDIHAGSSDSSRVACLEFRCPSSDSSPVLVQVVPVLRTAICNVSWVNPTAQSMKALQEGLPDPLNVTVTSGNNYGPKYGIYVAMGTRDNAQFSARQQCYSGKSFDVVSISPTKGTLADIEC